MPYVHAIMWRFFWWPFCIFCKAVVNGAAKDFHASPEDAIKEVVTRQKQKVSDKTCALLLCSSCCLADVVCGCGVWVWCVGSSRVFQRALPCRTLLLLLRARARALYLIHLSSIRVDITWVDITCSVLGSLVLIGHSRRTRELGLARSIFLLSVSSQKLRWIVLWTLLRALATSRAIKRSS